MGLSGWVASRKLKTIGKRFSTFNFLPVLFTNEIDVSLVGLVASIKHQESDVCFVSDSKMCSIEFTPERLSCCWISGKSVAQWLVDS